HASLDPEKDGIRLVDLGSRNGTWVNGLRVYDAVLQGGETITLGDTRLLVGSTTPIEIEAAGSSRFGKTIGKSPAMRRLY
ncbi:FHA domain-containing protein, partial [Escherichia coli]|uniref:FHA domain-containing protein n=1 Tax=Escherichia coli TaxID=562 RepID=UPI00159B9514